MRKVIADIEIGDIMKICSASSLSEMALILFQKVISSQQTRFSLLQRNPVNTTTFGPWKIGRINGVVVLKGFFK